MLVTLMAFLPILLSVIVWTALVVPKAWLANVRLAGARETVVSSISDAVSPLKFAVARSSFPSLLKSPAVIPTGRSPAGNSTTF
jgi:hypothetical protein